MCTRFERSNQDLLSPNVYGLIIALVASEDSLICHLQRHMVLSIVLAASKDLLTCRKNVPAQLLKLPKTHRHRSLELPNSLKDENMPDGTLARGSNTRKDNQAKRRKAVTEQIAIFEWLELIRSQVYPVRRRGSDNKEDARVRLFAKAWRLIVPIRIRRLVTLKFMTIGCRADGFRLLHLESQNRLRCVLARREWHLDHSPTSNRSNCCCLKRRKCPTVEIERLLIFVSRSDW